MSNSKLLWKQAKAKKEKGKAKGRGSNVMPEKKCLRLGAWLAAWRLCARRKFVLQNKAFTQRRQKRQDSQRFLSPISASIVKHDHANEP
jgi:hypothetical protein